MATISIRATTTFEKHFGRHCFTSEYKTFSLGSQTLNILKNIGRVFRGLAFPKIKAVKPTRTWIYLWKFTARFGSNAEDLTYEAIYF